MLRGLAALAVVVNHLPFSWSSGLDDAAGSQPALPEAVGTIANYGHYGVNLFLVISGFCIHMQWARRDGDHSEVHFLDFWKRRLRRLYPPYFVALVCSFAGLFVLARLSARHAPGLAGLFGYPSDAQLLVDVVLLLLLAQNVNGASERVGNGPFWSLALEEQLYLLYFPFLTVRRKWGWARALPLVIVVTFAWRAAFAFTPNPPAYWYIVGPGRWLEWVLGALAVEMHLGRIKAPRWLSSPVTLGAVAVVALLVVPPRLHGVRPWSLPGASALNDVLFSFVAFVGVNWCCRLDREGRLAGPVFSARLAQVGLFSYSLYLVHYPVMVVVKRLALKLGVHNVPALLTLRFGAALAAGYLFFRVVESHFLRASRSSDRATSPGMRKSGNDGA